MDRRTVLLAGASTIAATSANAAVGKLGAGFGQLGNVAAMGGGGIPAPIADWKFKDYQAINTNGGVVANSLAATQPNLSLFALPRRQYALGQLWGKSGGCSFADDDKTAWDGTASASTITIAGGSAWFVYGGLTASPPTGTFTVAVWARLASGVGTFKLGRPFAGVWSGNFTPTSSWQRFSAQVTYNNGDFAGFGIGTDNTGPSAGVIEFSDLDLWSGSTDFGAEALAGHMHIYAGTPAHLSFAGGLLKISDIGGGVIQFPSRHTTDAFTVIAIEQMQTGFNDLSNAYKVTLSGFEDDSLFIGPDIPLAPGVAMGPVGLGSNNILSEAQLLPYLADCEGQGLSVKTYVWTGNQTDCWINGVKITSQAGPSSFNPGYDRLYFNIAAHWNSHPGYSKTQRLILWDKALTDAQLLAQVAQVTADAATASNTIPAARWGFIAGDDVAARKAPYLAAKNVTNKLRGANYGYNGALVADAAFIAVINRIIARKAQAAVGEKVIALVYMGSGDLGSGNSAAILTALAAKCDTLRAAGVLVIACTLIDRVNASQSQYNTDRAAFNTAVRLWVGSHADAVADLAAVSGMGANSDHANATNFTSGLAPTDTGDALLEPTITAAFDSL